MDTVGIVEALYRYPVKGLSPDALRQVHVRQGECFPYDRAYALENKPGAFDEAAPAYLPKKNFLMLMDNECLARLETRFEDEGQTLIVLQDGRERVRASLADDTGRAAIAAFFQEFVGEEARGEIRVVSAQGHSFSDVPKKVVSLLNLDSVRDLAGRAGVSLDPLRFRANVHLRRVEAWHERDWVGKSFRLGGAEIRVTDEIVRCAATQVDPATGARDIDVPALLERHMEHQFMGVYAEVIGTGTIKPGDHLELL